MKKAAIEILDSRAFWATVAGIAGTVFGDKVAAIVGAVGSIFQIVI